MKRSSRPKSELVMKNFEARRMAVTTPESTPRTMVTLMKMADLSRIGTLQKVLVALSVAEAR